MELRKVQETGGGTFLVSLPKDWAKRSALSRGSFVTLVERGDGCLVIDPARQPEQLTETTVLVSSGLEREITGKYLLGYDVIKVETEGRIRPEDRETVKTTCRRLVGLEVIEEDARRIVMQCLLESSALTPEKVLRREHLIASGMHKEAVTALLESDERLARGVFERDEEVNRLYFLLVRLLRTVIQHPPLSEQLKISPIDCLDLRLVASLVEGISDSAAEIAWYVYKFPKAPLPSSLLRQIAKLSELAYEIHEKAMKSVFARDFQLAMSIISVPVEIKTILTEVEGALTKLPPDLLTHASAIVSCLKRIYEYGMDIADLVMPE